MMTAADLSSLADDLEKRCENVDQLDFLVSLIAWLSDQTADARSCTLLPETFKLLSDHFYEMADSFGAADEEEVADALRNLHAILGAKYCKAVGRA
jgi:hypothetical protein